MKKILLIMLLTFTTIVASNEGESQGRFVIEKMIKDDSSILTDRHFVNGVWIIDTTSGAVQGCVFLKLPQPQLPEVFCSVWSKRLVDY